MDLPDLKAKVKVDTSGIGEAEAKLAAFSATVKQELNENTGLKSFEQRSGQAFVKFGDDGKIASLRISSATAQTKADLEQLESRTRTFADGMEHDFKRGASAVVKLGDDGEASLARVTRQMEQVGASATQTADSVTKGANQSAAATGGLAGVAGALIPILIGVAVALGLVLLPLAAMTVGLAAALSVIVISVGALAALGAGIVLLANHYAAGTQASQNATAAQAALTKATNDHTVAVRELDTFQANTKGMQLNAVQLQQLGDLQKGVTDTTYKLAVAQNAVAAASGATVSPLAQLTQHLGEMADRLGQKALPLAYALTTLLDQMLPGIERVGTALLDAFGSRMAPILSLFSYLFEVLGSAIAKVGVALAKFIDHFLSQAPQFQQLFLDVFDKAAVNAIQGLLDNLVRLSDWFMDRLPTLGPVAMGTLGQIGSLVQWLAERFGQLADWVGGIERVLSGSGSGWEKYASFLQMLGLNAQQAHDYIAILRPPIEAIGEVLGNVAKAVKESWPVIVQAVGPVVALFVSVLAPSLKIIAEHSTELKIVLYAVAIALGVIVIAAVIVVGAIVGLVVAAVWLKAQFELLQDTVLKFVASGIRAFISFAATVPGILGKLGADISAFWAGLTSTVHGAATALWNGAVGIFRGGVALVVGVVQGLVDGIVGFWVWLYGHNYYFQALVDDIVAQFQRAKAEAAAIVGAMVGWVTGKWQELHNAGAAIFSAISGMLGEKTGQARSNVMSEVGAMVGWVTSRFWQLHGEAASAWNGVAGAVGSGMSGAWNAVAGIGNRIGGYLGGLAGQAWGWGANMVSGFVNGIWARMGDAINAASAVANAVKSILGFHSPPPAGPAKDADQWMPNLIKMMTSGLRAGEGSVRSASAQVALAIATPVGGGGTGPEGSSGSSPAFPSQVTLANDRQAQVVALLEAIHGALVQRPGGGVSFPTAAYGRT